MKISHVKIHNWRSIKDIEIDFQELMVVIGQNNHGKSNILYALLFFFGKIDCNDLDFYRNTNELYVEVTFTNLDDHDKQMFEKYLTGDEKICVRKQASKSGSSEYHGYCQIPTDEFLRAESMTKADFEQTPLKDYLENSVRFSKTTFQETQKKYIEKNYKSLHFNYELESNYFLGLKTVAQGIFGNIFFVPAVRSAAEELGVKGQSIFNQLLTNVINTMSEKDEKYRKIKEDMGKLINSLNKPGAEGEENLERPEEITNLEKRLEKELSGWDTKIDIEVTPPDIDNVLRIGTNVWVDDGMKTDVNRKGHGLQRGLIFALIKSWAAVIMEELKKQYEGDTREGDEQIEQPTRKTSRSTYFIFEEPELYLHPQAQKELYASLKLLAEQGNQVILTTHSSFFIDLKNYKSICIAYKDNIETGTKARQCSDELFTVDSDIKNFNLSYWINPDRGELFFAKKTILVEGQTDNVVIPKLAKDLGVFRHDYTLIDCGGKGNMPIYLTLLSKFRLPYIAVYDKDHQDGKDQSGIDSANQASKLIEDTIDSTLGTSVVLVNDIDEEIGIMDSNKKNKPFSALKKISDPDFSISSSLKQKIEAIFT
jgi:AAA15 family ATPase/GTPase